MKNFIIAIFFLILFFNINVFGQNESSLELPQSISLLSNETLTLQQENNENLNTTTTTETILHQHQQQYSSAFITETDIAVRQIKQDEWPILESRLRKILLSAFKESMSAHFQQNRQTMIMETQNQSNPFTVQILGTTNVDGITKLNFVSFFNNQTVPSDVIVKDISLLTLSHLSAVLQYPVIDIRAQYETKRTEQSRWWIVGIILGSGILIILFGWCCLFIYYNSCGRPIAKYHPSILRTGNEIMEESTKHVQFKKGTRWEEPSRILENNQNFVKDEIVNSPTSPLKIVEEMKLQKSLTPPPSPLLVEVKPVAEQEANDEFNKEIRPPTPIAGKFENPEQTLKQDFEPNIETSDHKPPNLHLERPKSAHAHRSPSNEFLIPNDPITSSAWSPYQPGDFVAFTYGVQLGLAAQYPRPSPSTSTGVIELASSNTKKQLEFN